MNHWIIAPLLLPPLVGSLVILRLRYHLPLTRAFSVASVVALLAICVWLLWQSATGPIQVYRLGNWPAPNNSVLASTSNFADCIAFSSIRPSIAHS